MGGSSGSVFGVRLSGCQVVKNVNYILADVLRLALSRVDELFMRFMLAVAARGLAAR